MKMNKIYGLCAVQLMGVGVQLMNRVQKGLNKRERSRAKRLQTIRKAFVHTFDYGFF